MILHEDKKAFIEAIRATSDFYNTRDVFVEKDYWATYILRQLSQSDYKDKVVFKGGTSLSKAYNLINRFSEDVDLALLDANKYNGNEVKELIRTIEKTITVGLSEINIDGLTSKHSTLRRTAYSYEKSLSQKGKPEPSDKIVLEINSFANPVPYEVRSIDSMIGKYFFEKGFLYLREKDGLRSFNVNTLLPKQTLIEKLVSIIRFSYSNKDEDGLDKKIRHFYDIYFLTESTYCKVYLESKDFLIDFNKLYKEDLERFKEPQKWVGSKIEESPLLIDFTSLWTRLKSNYERELNVLVYDSLISPDIIYQKVEYILNKIRGFYQMTNNIKII